MNVGDIYVSIRGDGAPLKKDAVAAATTAGDAAGKSFSDRFGSVVRTGAKAVFLGGAAVFTGLSFLANQGADAMARYRAETGATQEEAEDALGRMDRLAKSNLQSFGVVADVLTQVRTQMGLTGDEGERMAERILKWSTATGQDAVAATEAWDDALDAWNLTADDSQAVMDVLLASHQKYGGAIAASQDALTKLAPALTAANMGWEDAVGLINLANDAGIEAADMVPALQRALTKVKSPEELKTLLADIGGTADAFARTEKAADLFGSRGAAKLGRALGEAGGDLDRFKVHAEDAAGAVDEAASAIEDTLPNKVKMAVNSALASLRDLGTDFGPALTGSAALISLGSSFASALRLDKAIGAVLGPAFTAASNSPIVQTVVKAAGANVGKLFVLGMSIGLAALIIDTWVKAINDAREEIINDPGSVEIVEGVAGRAPVWAAARLRAGQEAQKLGADVLAKFNDGYSKAALAGKTPYEAIADGLRAVGPEGERIAKEIGGEVWEAFKNGVVYGPPLPPGYITGRLFGGPSRGTFLDTATEQATRNSAIALVNDFYRAVGDAIARQQLAAGRYLDPITALRSLFPPKAAEAAGEETAASFVGGFSGYDFVRKAVEHAKMLAGFRAIGTRIPAEIAAGGQERENDLLAFLSNLREILLHGLSPRTTLLRLVGGKAVDDFVAGLNSKKAGAEEAAIDLFVATVTAAQDANLHGAKGRMAWRKIGREVVALYAHGIDEEGVRAILAGAGLSQAAIDAAIKAANDTRTGAKPAGRKHGHKHADGIRDTQRDNREAGSTISQAGVNGSGEVDWTAAGRIRGGQFAAGVLAAIAERLGRGQWTGVIPTPGSGGGRSSNAAPFSGGQFGNSSARGLAAADLAPDVSPLSSGHTATVRHEFGTLRIETPNLTPAAAGALGTAIGVSLGLDTIVSGFDRVLTADG